MSYVALYRKYRPNNFENVVGQEMTVKVLINSIKNKHISHAYLFTGPRGTGKTSIAKIFAKAVNCLDFNQDLCGKCDICNALKENDSDIVEIDAASNNGVDEIRTLRDNVKLMPSFCNYKIYIIDEVHMLSAGAFNALLKTLEEPPSHVIFILATTEPNKIPLTILSRCQRFDFNKVETKKVAERLKYILKNEKIELNDEIVDHIAKITDGCLRDAVNLLDQTIALNKNEETTINDVDKLSGKIEKNTIFSMFKAILDENYSEILEITSKLSKEGKNLIDLADELLILMRDISINNRISNYFSEEYRNKLSSYVINEDKIIKISQILNEMINEMKYSNNQQIVFEIYMMNISNTINNKYQSMQIIKGNSDEENINNFIKKEPEENNSLNTKKNEVENNKNMIDEEEKNNSNKEIDLEELKKIRINNTLAKASKEELNKVLQEYDRINDYFSNKKYNTFVEILNNAKVVVASENNLILSFKDEANISIFDNNYRQIEIFLQEIYQKEYKIVAISEDNWQKTKEEYIFNKKNNISYVLLEENVVKLKKENNSDKTTEEELENSATDLFGENMVSIK